MSEDGPEKSNQPAGPGPASGATCGPEPAHRRGGGYTQFSAWAASRPAVRRPEGPTGGRIFSANLLVVAAY
jgi:hypothetical protein